MATLRADTPVIDGTISSHAAARASLAEVAPETNATGEPPPHASPLAVAPRSLGHTHGGPEALPAPPAEEEPPSWTARLLPFRCWRARSNAARLLALRVLLRVLALAALVALIRSFPGAAVAAGTAVLGWIHTHPSPFAELIFFGASSLFCAVSPTGYLPAVAAGIAFPPASAIPVTYASVLLGAALNVALVRGVCRRRREGAAAQPPPRFAARFEARGAALLTGALREAIAAQPVLMVALLRLPFLGNGALNYILSLHPHLPVAPMMAGNALGMALGSVLFPLAGAQVRSLGSMIAEGPGEGAARASALGWFFGILGVVALALGGASLVVRRALRRIAAARDAEKAAAAAEWAATCTACAAALAEGAGAVAPLPAPLQRKRRCL